MRICPPSASNFTPDTAIEGGEEQEPSLLKLVPVQDAKSQLDEDFAALQCQLAQETWLLQTAAQSELETYAEEMDAYEEASCSEPGQRDPRESFVAECAAFRVELAEQSVAFREEKEARILSHLVVEEVSSELHRREIAESTLLSELKSQREAWYVENEARMRCVLLADEARQEVDEFKESASEEQHLCKLLTKERDEILHENEAMASLWQHVDRRDLAKNREQLPRDRAEVEICREMRGECALLNSELAKLREERTSEAREQVRFLQGARHDGHDVGVKVGHQRLADEELRNQVLAHKVATEAWTKQRHQLCEMLKAEGRQIAELQDELTCELQRASAASSPLLSVRELGKPVRDELEKAKEQSRMLREQVICFKAQRDALLEKVLDEDSQKEQLLAQVSVVGMERDALLLLVQSGASNMAAQAVVASVLHAAPQTEMETPQSVLALPSAEVGPPPVGKIPVIGSPSPVFHQPSNSLSSAASSVVSPVGSVPPPSTMVSREKSGSVQRGVLRTSAESSPPFPGPVRERPRRGDARPARSPSPAKRTPLALSRILRFEKR